jgi:acid stress chaperone HdeB
MAPRGVAVSHAGQERMPGKVASAILVVAALLAAAPADAQVIDLSALTCKQFIELPKETLNAVTLWLDAYLTDEEESAVIDFDKMKGKAERLAAYCAQNPEMSLMAAAENVMDK